MARLRHNDAQLALKISRPCISYSVTSRRLNHALKRDLAAGRLADNK